MMSTDLIGLKTLKVFNIVGPNNGMTMDYDILFQKKMVGKIKLRTQYFPTNT